MENTTSKSLSEPSEEALKVAKELASKTVYRTQTSEASELVKTEINRLFDKLGYTLEAPSTGFIPRFATCAIHGQYRLNYNDGGVDRAFPDVCPVCQKLSAAEQIFASSNIPKRFRGCDFSTYETVTDDQAKVLARCKAYAQNFAKNREQGSCLLLCGRPGTGKNHLATSIGKSVLAAGFSVLRIKASQFLDGYWAKSFDDREDWIKDISKVDLLMLDEIGKSSQAKAAQDAFFRLLDSRYEAQLPSIILTNLNRQELIEVLGEPTYDRLTQGGSVRLTLDWDSHRAKKGLS